MTPETKWFSAGPFWTSPIALAAVVVWGLLFAVLGIEGISELLHGDYFPIELSLVFSLIPIAVLAYAAVCVRISKLGITRDGIIIVRPIGGMTIQWGSLRMFWYQGVSTYSMCYSKPGRWAPYATLSLSPKQMQSLLRAQGFPIWLVTSTVEDPSGVITTLLRSAGPPSDAQWVEYGSKTGRLDQTAEKIGISALAVYFVHRGRQSGYPWSDVMPPKKANGDGTYNFFVPTPGPKHPVTWFRLSQEQARKVLQLAPTLQKAPPEEMWNVLSIVPRAQITMLPEV